VRHVVRCGCKLGALPTYAASQHIGKRKQEKMYRLNVILVAIGLA